MRTVVAALAAMVVLGGCADDPTPQFEPTPSQPPTETPSAAEPEPWEEKTDEGAIAFVEHWVETFNNMQSSGDTDLFRSLGTADCVACDNFVEITDSIYADGSTVTSEGWSIEAADVPPGQSGPERDVSVVVQQSAETIEAPDGTVDTNPEGQITVIATLKWSNSRWLMRAVEFPS